MQRIILLERNAIARSGILNYFNKIRKDDLRFMQISSRLFSVFALCHTVVVKGIYPYVIVRLEIMDIDN